MKSTVPGTSESDVVVVSVRLTVTVSAFVSSTVTVTDAVPSGIEIDPGVTVANPVTPTAAAYAA